jgi:di/tricarboxylate transporter
VTLFIAAIVLSIGLSFVLKLNAGSFAMVFAFINGIYFYGFSVKDVVAMWPVNLFLMLFTVMFFYSFAISNGTIEKLAAHIAYRARNIPWLLPIALWLFCMAIAASGAGPYAVWAFLAPIVIGICVKSGISPILAAVTVISGGSIGGQCPISVGGIVIKNYAAISGFEAISESISLHVFWNTLLGQGLVFWAVYGLTKGYRTKMIAIDEPESLSKRQILNLWIILFVLLLTVLPAVAAFIFPHVEVVILMKKAGDVTVTSSIGILLCFLFKISTEKEAFSKVPWSTILLICGIGMLIQTAVSIGVIKSLSAWISENIEGRSAIYLLIATSAVMSFFSSTLGVVVPTLSTLVPVFASITGTDPGFLFSILTVPALLTGYSPFSSSGAITMTGASSEAERQLLFRYMLAAPFIMFAVSNLLVFTGLMR